MRSPLRTRGGRASPAGPAQALRLRYSHDFLQVHIDLLTGRVYLVPTLRPPPPRRQLATSSTTSASTTLLDGPARGAGCDGEKSLIFGSPHRHNTTSKVERVNGVIADILRPFAGERADEWPALVLTHTPFYADRGQHPAAP